MRNPNLVHLPMRGGVRRRVRVERCLRYIYEEADAGYPRNWAEEPLTEEIVEEVVELIKRTSELEGGE